MATINLPLLPVGADEEWRDLALCAQADPDAFFPGKGDPIAAARAVCRRCPVARECLEDALAQDEQPHGIWGGKSRRERLAIKAREAGAAA